MLSPEAGPVNWVLLHFFISTLSRTENYRQNSLSEIATALRNWLERESIWWVLSLVYLYAAVQKFESSAWREGIAMSLILNGAFSSGIGRMASHHLSQFSLHLMTWGPLALEFSFMISIRKNTSIRIALTVMCICMMLLIATLTRLGQVATGMILVHLYAINCHYGNFQGSWARLPSAETPPKNDAFGA
jgi:hypothetical protein